MLVEEPPERVAGDGVFIRDQLDDASEVGNEIALVAVCQDGWHCRRVELDVVVVHLDEAHLAILSHQRPERNLCLC